MFNLQANAHAIAKGIETDLDMEMCKLGIGITGMTIQSFSYPEEVKKMQEKAASQSMIGDMNRYQQMAVADGMKAGRGSGVAADMAGIQMGMMMGQQMMNQMQNASGSYAAPSGNTDGPKFCPNCGTPTGGSRFCGNCGAKLKE